MSRSQLTVDTSSFRKEVARMIKNMEPKELSKIHRKELKPMLHQMKSDSPSVNIAAMTAITTRKKNPGAPPGGARIGVINTDSSRFPGITAPALASILEYGSRQRKHKSGKSVGAVTSVHAWLRKAWDAHVDAYIRSVENAIEKKING